MKSYRRRLIFVGNFFSAIPGAWAVSEDVAKRLAALGWSVITTSHKLHRFPRLVEMILTVWGNRRRYDVAHVDVFSGPAFVWAEVVCWVLRRMRKPYILTLRGGNLVVFADRSPHRVGRLLKGAAIVTSPSRFLQEQLQSHCANLRMIPNALDIGKYEFRPRAGAQPRLIWLRAFHDIYNPSLAPRVVKNLVDEFPGITLIMIGRDKLDGSLQLAKSMSQELGVFDRITFQLGVSKEDVPKWLNKGDIFLNTTNVDNTPMSVIEAMAVGMCIVSTDVGGLPYLLEDQQDALLVSTENPGAMTQQVARILHSPKLAEHLSRNARAKAIEFDWSNMLPLWDSLFTSVAAESAGKNNA